MRKNGGKSGKRAREWLKGAVKYCPRNTYYRVAVCKISVMHAKELRRPLPPREAAFRARHAG